MTPVQCRTCRHFIPWPSNPEQAVGECGHGHGSHFAGETHRCADHEPKPKPEDAHDAATKA